MSEITELLDLNGEFGADPALRAPQSFVQGRVTDNGDKEHPGMVKVEFLSWKEGGNICEWMPVLRSYAGKEYGVYCVPEVEDIVLVGFLGPQMKRPFVMGVFYPAGAKYPGQNFDAKNLKKTARTKGGLELVLSDEDKKQSCTFTTPKGITAAVSDETETVTIKDKDGKNKFFLDCKKGALEITTEKKITLKTGKCTVTIDGQGGEVSVECTKFTVKAQQQAAVTANQSLELSGGMLKAEGKQTAEFKGGTMAQLSAAMVKIN